MCIELEETDCIKMKYMSHQQSRKEESPRIHVTIVQPSSAGYPTTFSVLPTKSNLKTNVATGLGVFEKFNIDIFGNSNVLSI